MDQRALDRWIIILAILCAKCVLLWAGLGAAMFAAKTHGGQWPPVEVRGLILTGLGTFTLICVYGLGDLIRHRSLMSVQCNILAGQRLILDAFAEQAERTEPVARMAPVAPVRGIATIVRPVMAVAAVSAASDRTTVDLSAPQRRPRRRGRGGGSRARLDPTAAFMNDAAEVYELGRRAERARLGLPPEDGPPPPDAPLSPL